MAQKRVFITGSSGLVGAKLVYELWTKSYKISALIRNRSSKSKLTNQLKFYTNDVDAIINAIDWVEGDISDCEILMNHIESDMQVYHCAAMVSFNPKNNESLYLTNVQGTSNIVNVCVEKEVNKFCHVSSIGALGTAAAGEQTDIDSPWLNNGKSPYSKSKHESEMEVWRGIAEGLNAVIVNPAVIIGAGDWDSGSSALFSKVAKGMSFYTLGSTAYVYVNDVVDAMIQLTESEISNERFLLSSENLTFKEVFEKIAEALGAKIPSKRANSFITALAWRIEAVRIKFIGGEPLISKYSHKIAHNKNSYNGLPITKVLDFKYTPIDTAITEVSKLYRSFIS